MFKRASGKPNIQYFPKVASTAYTNGSLVNAASGAILAADSTSGDHLGILMRDVVSTDGDYAAASLVPVDVPSDTDVFEVDVTTGTLTTAMIGGFYDLTDHLGINVSAQAKSVVQIVGFISASKAFVRINSTAGNKDVATS